MVCMFTVCIGFPFLAIDMHFITIMKSIYSYISVYHRCIYKTRRKINNEIFGRLYIVFPADYCAVIFSR